MNILKSRGPNTDPSGTPVINSDQETQGWFMLPDGHSLNGFLPNHLTTLYVLMGDIVQLIFNSLFSTLVLF